MARKKLYDQYSKNLLKGAGKDELRILDDEKTLDRLKRYKEWKDAGGELEILFSFVSEEGNLIAQDENGVKIVLLNDVLKKDMEYYTPKVGEKLVANAFIVSITDIDEEKSVIYVKSARGGNKAKRATIKSRLVGELISDLKKEHLPRVAGKVVKVTQKSAIVNIFDRGILGICYIENWGKSYYRHLKEQCRPGDVFEFEIVRQMAKKPGKPMAFELSRKEIAPDPWESIPDEYLTKGAIITVKCVEKMQNRSYWWGVSELIPGIEIQGDYTKRCTIMVGGTYKCSVDLADKENHRFRVVPFDIADSDVGTKRAIRFLETKKKVD